jgi:hypothetical protein
MENFILNCVVLAFILFIFKNIITLINNHDAHRPDCDVGWERRVHVYHAEKICCPRLQESITTKGLSVL